MRLPVCFISVNQASRAVSRHTLKTLTEQTLHALLLLLQQHHHHQLRVYVFACVRSRSRHVLCDNYGRMESAIVILPQAPIAFSAE